MTSVFNRRTALGLLGAGSAAFLAACAPLRSVKKSSGDSSSSSSSSSPNSHSPEPSEESVSPAASTSSSSPASSEPAKSYKGEAKLEKYDTSAGTYEPGTSEHPPRNVPKPIKPANMNENSVAGLYSTIAFYAASFQYFVTTGDRQYLDQVKTDEEEDLSDDDEMAQYIAGGVAWFENPKIVITLTTDQPTKSGSSYTWPSTVVFDYGKNVHNAQGQTAPVPSTGAEKPQKGYMKGKYTGGVWEVTIMIYDLSDNS